MKFTIDRSRWVSGVPHWGLHSENTTGMGETSLLNEHGFMCCLGFVCRQLGLHSTDIYERGAPDFLILEAQDPLVPILLDDKGNPSRLTALAMNINDDNGLTPAEREQQLIALFKEHGHEITFEGKYTQQ